MPYSDNELIGFARRIDIRMGRQMETLLKFKVVGFAKDWEFMALMKHLETHEDFNILTGFDFNRRKGLIWLDSLEGTLKEQFANKD